MVTFSFAYCDYLRSATFYVIFWGNGFGCKRVCCHTDRAFLYKVPVPTERYAVRFPRIQLRLGQNYQIYQLNMDAGLASLANYEDGFQELVIYGFDILRLVTTVAFCCSYETTTLTRRDETRRYEKDDKS